MRPRLVATDNRKQADDSYFNVSKGAQAFIFAIDFNVSQGTDSEISPGKKRHSIVVRIES